MQVYKFREIRCGKGDTVSIYPLGDIHAGTIHCVEEEIREKVREIQSDPLALWIGMGDLGEFITPSDPRWEPSQFAMAKWLEPDNIAEGQRKWLRNLLKPIADKGIGLLTGNHENSFRIHSHNNIHQNLCDDLGLPNLGYTVFVHFTFSRHAARNDTRMYKGVFTHGGGSSITRGGKLNRLEKFMNNFDADFYGYAHMHDIITSSAPQLTTTKNLMIKERKRVGAVTGCWFRSYSQGTLASYGEIKGYSPTTMGCPVFRIRPYHDDLWIEGRGVKK